MTRRIVSICSLTFLMLAGLASGQDLVTELTTIMDDTNLALEAEGADYRLVVIETISDGSASEMGITLISKDVGNKQLGFDFVPFDDRRAWSAPGDGATDSITYAIDTTGDAVPVFGGLDADDTDAAIERATATWDVETCSDLGSLRNDDFGIDVGVVAFILSGGIVGSPFVFADVQHAGWRDLDFGGGVLGVTFTFGFTDGAGNFTDVDNNNKLDAAFREIYYDPSFSWADDGVSNIDVETVALHEIGHGLSQAHFGQVFFQNNGGIQASPRAVMNAVYLGPERSLLGTDHGGHCSNWGQWPNN